MNKLKSEGKDPRNKTTGENVLQASTADMFTRQPATKAIRSSKTNEGSYHVQNERLSVIRRSSKKNETSNENTLNGPFSTNNARGDYSYVKAYGKYTNQF